MGDLGIKLPKLIPSGRYRCRFSASLDPNPRATAIDRLPFHLSCLSWRIRGRCDQGWYDGRDARFIVKVWHAVNALEMSYSEEQAILSTVIPYHLNSRKCPRLKSQRWHIANETVPVRVRRLPWRARRHGAVANARFGKRKAEMHVELAARSHELGPLAPALPGEISKATR
jgi:hypothetical protein